MAWSLAILDDGITNKVQASSGKRTTIEHNFYDGTADTDDGFSDTHANEVFRSALKVSRSYDVLDLKVADPYSGDYSDFSIEQALNYVVDNPALHIAAVNMSFGGEGYPYSFADEIATLAARGVVSVVAAGNDGDQFSLERPLYPAALPNVIAVGSHDGAGHPSDFSQNGRGVDILADGEDMPRAGVDGTSVAAPRSPPPSPTSRPLSSV